LSSCRLAITLYDSNGGINLLDDLVYRPTVAVTDTVNVTLTLDVFDGSCTRRSR
jgi:hypothetical protein